MRKKDLKDLEKPYEKQPQNIFDNRFESVIGADIPSAKKLVEEIFDDFDVNSFGIKWWNSLPTHQRILIGDYLYQCADGIEINLTEAKLHYLEWLDAREKNNEKIITLLSRQTPSQNPSEDLYRKLEEIHISGFFRAIGSSLDCLGSAIVGVLALPISLRRSDIGKAESALSKINVSIDKGSILQAEFRDLFSNIKKSSGVSDWLEWSDQYRNMLVHRGRRTIYFGIVHEKPRLLDSRGRAITKAQSTMHLPKYPDRTDIEAFIKATNINLSEDADVTLKGIFKSCRNLCEQISEKLVEIWQERRENPNLIQQPVKQWDNKIRSCVFDGYIPNSTSHDLDAALVNPILGRRMKAGSIFDNQRSLWDNSDWS